VAAVLSTSELTLLDVDVNTTSDNIVNGDSQAAAVSDLGSVDSKNVVARSSSVSSVLVDQTVGEWENVWVVVSGRDGVVDAGVLWNEDGEEVCSVLGECAWSHDDATVISSSVRTASARASVIS
jgi:hypothetical protein